MRDTHSTFAQFLKNAEVRDCLPDHRNLLGWESGLRENWLFPVSRSEDDNTARARETFTLYFMYQVPVEATLRRLGNTHNLRKSREESRTQK